MHIVTAAAASLRHVNLTRICAFHSQTHAKLVRMKTPTRDATPTDRARSRQTPMSSSTSRDKEIETIEEAHKVCVRKIK